MTKKGGWFGESRRHSLASRGLKTGTVKKKPSRYSFKHTYPTGESTKQNPFNLYAARDSRKATEYGMTIIKREWPTVKEKAETNHGQGLWDYVDEVADTINRKYPHVGVTDTASEEAIWEFMMKKAGSWADYEKWADKNLAKPAFR
jgi:hypothetical protein